MLYWHVSNGLKGIDGHRSVKLFQNFEGGCRDLVEVTTPTFLWTDKGKPRRTWVRKAGNLVDINSEPP
jgi:hypothetical protein